MHTTRTMHASHTHLPLWLAVQKSALGDVLDKKLGMIQSAAERRHLERSNEDDKSSCTSPLRTPLRRLDLKVKETRL